MTSIALCCLHCIDIDMDTTWINRLVCKLNRIARHSWTVFLNSFHHSHQAKYSWMNESYIDWIGVSAPDTSLQMWHSQKVNVRFIDPFKQLRTLIVCCIIHRICDVLLLAGDNPLNGYDTVSQSPQPSKSRRSSDKILLLFTHSNPSDTPEILSR